MQDRRRHRRRQRHRPRNRKEIRRGGAYAFIADRRQDELDKAVTAISENVTDVKTDLSKLTTSTGPMRWQRRKAKST
jgi:hypothetical protein